MLYYFQSYLYFLRIWWKCLYRKTEHYHIVDQYLSPLYEYVNTHQTKLDLIRKIFGPLTYEMYLLLGYVHEQQQYNNYLNTPNDKQYQSDISITETESYYTINNTNRSFGGGYPYGDNGDAYDKYEIAVNVNILPEPKDIRNVLIEQGYYDKSNDKLNGYNGNDFNGYKNIVINMQTNNNLNLINNCNLMLFPKQSDSLNSGIRNSGNKRTPTSRSKTENNIRADFMLE